MSQSISFKNRILPILFSIRIILQEIEIRRKEHDWVAADELRDVLLHLDSGMRITQDATGKVTLWHFPNPPFIDQFHMINYGEFIANSREDAR